MVLGTVTWNEEFFGQSFLFHTLVVSENKLFQKEYRRSRDAQEPSGLHAPFLKTSDECGIEKGLGT